MMFYVQRKMSEVSHKISSGASGSYSTYMLLMTPLNGNVKEQEVEAGAGRPLSPVGRRNHSRR